MFRMYRIRKTKTLTGWYRYTKGGGTIRGWRWKAVLRIYDILVWIRIRGSMPLTNGSGSCYFRHWPQDANKNFFFFNCSAYYFLKVHLHHFSKIKSQKELQNSRNQEFSYYFCMMKGDPDPEPDPYLWLMDPNPGGPKTCGSGGSGFGLGSGSATLVEGGMKQSADAI